MRHNMMQADAADDDLQRVEEAAATLGVSGTTVWRLVRRGHLQVIRVLGRARFRRSDLLLLKKPVA